MHRFSFAIIGGGPSGFYLAKLLSKHPFHPTVHIYEKELTPFGLLRYGVAPDHLPIKNAENTLGEVSKYSNFRFFGNTDIDTHRFQYLRNHYSGVVYAYGASQNNTLGYEDFPARKFINWYNSHPSLEGINLKGVDDVVLVGNGNVSIDIARILLKDPEKLQKTDINLEALAELKRSTVKNVSVVGRRGAVQSSFTLKEIREIKGQGLEMCVLRNELQQSLNRESQVEATMDAGNHRLNLMRANKRKMAFLGDNCTVCETEQDLQRVLSKSNKKLIFRFLLQPTRRQGGFAIFHRTVLAGEPFQQVAKETKEEIRMKADLLISSMGFRSSALLDHHFDPTRFVVRNTNGCVIGNNKIDVGVYTVGWAKTGAVGIIDSTLLNCQESYNNLRIHMEEGVLEPKEGTPLLTEGQISYHDYLKIKEQELRRGKETGRDRVKLSNKEIVQFLAK